MSVKDRSIEMLMSEVDLAERRASLQLPKPVDAERGYRKLFYEQMTQADKGCDFELLRPTQIIARVPVK